MAFEKVKIKLGIAIHPKYLNDPSSSIFKQLSKHLLQYTHIISGFPLCFNIDGVLPAGKILENGSVYVDGLITFYIFKVTPGDMLYSMDGTICGIFNALIEGEESYTGEMVVKGVEKDMIIGTKISVEEEEF